MAVDTGEILVMRIAVPADTDVSFVTVHAKSVLHL